MAFVRRTGTIDEIFKRIIDAIGGGLIDKHRPFLRVRIRRGIGVMTNPHFKVVMIFVGRSRMFGFDEEKPIKFSFGGILYLLYTIHQINITLTHFQKMTK